MSIPQLRQDGWLPDGHWTVSWDEVVAVFGGEAGTYRAELTKRLVDWRDSARRVGLAGRLILDGSYVSAKGTPGDIDAIFVYDEASEEVLKRDEEARQVVNYVVNRELGLGDLFVYAEATARQFPMWCRLDAFDYDRLSGDSKGVVVVEI